MSTVERVWDAIRPQSDRPTALRFEHVGPAGAFAVRAEIPGVDATRDIRISRTDRLLSVEVVRTPTRRDQVRSEFHYGRSVGTVDLPRGVRAGRLSATYHRGVLTIAAASAGELVLGDPVAIGSGPSYLARPRPPD
jgi:HSP20 family molecular chaperone IbpA